jgi:type II secretory pathway pseudopilin PulG
MTSDKGQMTSRPAFTLVELMLSLAMVLILIVGINFVFRSATDAVGAGNALNSINSDTQATQPMIFDDLRNVAKNPPCFIISSQLVTQFLNSDDAKTGSDPTRIITDNSGGQNAGSNYVIGNGTSSATVTYISPAILDGRRHRADMLKFLAHGLYHRRSGPDGTYYASDSSNDAFIEYGHAALPSNDLSAFYGPSSLPNTISGVYNGATVTGVPRIGAYASDWVLARRVTLLKDPTSITNGPPTSNDYYYPVAVAGTIPFGITNWNAQNGITQIAQFGVGVNATPLSYGTPNNNPADNPASPALPQNTFQSSRYDLAGVTPEQFDRLIATEILNWQNNSPTAYAGSSLWWNSLMYALPMTQNTATPTPPQQYPRPGIASDTPPPFPPYVLSYFGAVPGYSATNAFTAGTPNTTPPVIDPGLWYARPQCNPTISTPVTAASLAEMAPYFLQHCSQFVVEYAGDYMQQDNRPFFPIGSTTINPAYGAMTGLGPDGQIDFYVDANGNKHIRWYGMPRSSTGTLHAGDSSGKLVLIRGYDPKDTTAGGADDPTAPGAANTYNAALNYFTDVIPLRDYYTMYLNIGSAPTLYAPPWEADVNFDPTHDYANAVAYKGGFAIFFGDPNNPPRYVAAWHDDMPAMIRILIKVDDPNNKVKDGPWYEYVFRLK